MELVETDVFLFIYIEYKELLVLYVFVLYITFFFKVYWLLHILDCPVNMEYGGQ